MLCNATKFQFVVESLALTLHEQQQGMLGCCLDCAACLAHMCECQAVRVRHKVKVVKSAGGRSFLEFELWVSKDVVCVETSVLAQFAWRNYRFVKPLSCI